MGHRSSRTGREESTSADSAGGTTSTAESTVTSEPDSNQADEIDRTGTLQRLEQTYGPRVYRWADEGMPPDVMGDPEKMREFRERTGSSDRDPTPESFVQCSTDSVAADASAGAQETVKRVLDKPGRPLDPDISKSLGERMDADFWDVRIHTGADAAEACDAIDARAFTAGSDIVFNDGEYRPESPEGQHLLAHELAHVRQQTGGAQLSMMPREDAALEIDPDPALEREAEDAAEDAMQDGPVTINRMGVEMHIQRMPEAEKLENARAQAESESDGMRLKQTVSNLQQRVSSIEETVSGGNEGWADKLGKATGKGAIGAVGGVAGAALGTMIAPGAGTAAGAVAGQQAVSEVAKGIAGDVTKTVYDPIYDKGNQAVADAEVPDINSDTLRGIKGLIDELLDEKMRFNDQARTGKGSDPFTDGDT
ncbi:DUF4157 domain-containing protein [Halostella sp. PRR32]|uniref:eCIS core domain-containing protein n=1 Tax=Halostella sp. PRR32 TaxID=3098147 RepID=UPI002B1E8223|nr:DUF4157 domain-containing protein [Halostella sp. PRR32]